MIDHQKILSLSSSVSKLYVSYASLRSFLNGFYIEGMAGAEVSIHHPSI